MQGGSCSTQAHDSWSYKGKADITSYPGNGLAIFLLSFIHYEWRLSFEHDACTRCHAPYGWKYKRSEWPMFNLLNPLFIASSFLGLMVSVSRCDGGLTVAWCKRVENPDIKKCTPIPVTPKSLCTHILTGSVFRIGGPLWESFSCNRL